MVRTFSPYTHTENGTTYYESAEYFGEVQMDEKSEMMLKRVRFHTVTQQCADEFMPLCTCKVRLTTLIFSRCQAKKQHREYDKGVYNITFFRGEAHFLLSVVGCEKKWQKRRGELKDQKVESEKRDAL